MSDPDLNASPTEESASSGPPRGAAAVYQLRTVGLTVGLQLQRLEEVLEQEILQNVHGLN